MAVWRHPGLLHHQLAALASAAAASAATAAAVTPAPQPRLNLETSIQFYRARGRPPLARPNDSWASAAPPSPLRATGVGVSEGRAPAQQLSTPLMQRRPSGSSCSRRLPATTKPGLHAIWREIKAFNHQNLGRRASHASPACPRPQRPALPSQTNVQ